MSTCIKPFALLFAASVILFGCKQKVNEYYDPPANPEPPVFEQLQAKGKFTQLLSLIDKAGYKETLNRRSSDKCSFSRRRYPSKPKN